MLCHRFEENSLRFCIATLGFQNYLVFKIDRGPVHLFLFKLQEAETVLITQSFKHFRGKSVSHISIGQLFGLGVNNENHASSLNVMLTQQFVNFLTIAPFSVNKSIRLQSGFKSEFSAFTLLQLYLIMFPFPFLLNFRFLLYDKFDILQGLEA